MVTDSGKNHHKQNTTKIYRNKSESMLQHFMVNDCFSVDKTLMTTALHADENDMS